MPKTKKFNFEKLASVVDVEDDATLAAIDEGVATPRPAEPLLREKFIEFFPRGLQTPLHAKRAERYVLACYFASYSSRYSSSSA
jgi:hypothetical protein